MVILDASGLPLAVHTDSASPHEVTLVQATLDETFTVGRLQRLLGIVPMTEIRVIESGQQRRMVARYGDIVAAGRWSDCFLGSTSTSTQLSDGITVTNALLPLFN